MFLLIGVPHKFGFQTTVENAKKGDIVGKGEPKPGAPISGNQVLGAISEVKEKSNFNQVEASNKDIQVFKD